MITSPIIWSNLSDRANNNVWDFVGSGAPTNGTSGTGAGFAALGSTYLDTVTGITYKNIGTVLSPTWQQGASVGDTAAGIGYIRSFRATYDFTVDGGAISTITPASGASLPANAIIIGGLVYVEVAPVGSGASVSIGTSAGSSTTSILAATAITALTLNSITDLVPVYTAASALRLSAAGNITFSISGHLLTAGKITVAGAYIVAK